MSKLSPFIMQPANQRLLLLLTLVACLYVGCAKANPEPISRLNDTFYEPTLQDMQKVHKEFLYSKKTLNQTAPPRPAVAQTILLRNVTANEFSSAKKLVADVHARQAVYNKWNIENPRRNQYTLKEARAEHHKRSSDLSPPTFSQEELDAIRLVGDVETQEMHNNGTLQRYHDDHKRYHERRQEKKRSADTNLVPVNTHADLSGESWIGQVDHSQSSQPFGGDSSYKVSKYFPKYRNKHVLTAYRSGEMFWTTAQLVMVCMMILTPFRRPLAMGTGAGPIVLDQRLMEQWCFSPAVSFQIRNSKMKPGSRKSSNHRPSRSYVPRQQQHCPLLQHAAHR